MMGDALFRLALRLVPRVWRDSVRLDVTEDAQAQGRGALWRIWQVLTIALPLHRTIAGGALFTDLRYVVRSLVRARWFTLGAMLTFALGIGINVAIFAVVDRALFRPLPFREPDRLVTVFTSSSNPPQRYFMFPRALATEMHRSSTAIDSMAYVGNWESYRVRGSEGPAIALSDATYNVLDTLGIAPALGRSFTQADARAHAHLALISDSVWRGRFGASPNVVGQRLDSYYTPADPPTEIIGVLPPDFVTPSVNWASGSDGLALDTDLTSWDDAVTKGGIPGIFARLRPGATVAIAQQQFDAAIVAMSPSTPPEKRNEVTVDPIQAGVFWRYRASLKLLFAAASLVWLLGCANLGTLILARSRSRETETAIRLSLGASTRRLLVSSLLESLVLCLAGAATAIVALVWAMNGVRALIPGFFKTMVVGSLDARVVGLSVAGATAGAIVAGLYPALRASRVDANRLLQVSARSSRRLRTGRLMLLTQASIATVLVIAAVLAIRSLATLMTIDLGFEPKRLYTLGRVTGAQAPDQLARQQRVLELREQLTQLSGIAGVTAADWYPTSAERLVGFTDEQGHRGAARRIFENYFDVMGTKILAGRTFTADERLAQAPVTVISARAAAQTWPGVSAAEVIGRSMRFKDDATAWQVVGVAGDTRSRPTADIEPEVFFPISPAERYLPRLLVRAASDTAPDVAALKEVVRRSFGDAASISLTPVTSSIAYDFQDPTLYVQLFGTFALVALVLSSVGLFALTSGNVAQREYEMGVRVSLGATSRDVRQLVIGDALLPVAAGIVVGMAAAYLAATSMQSLLFMISARDPWTYALVAIVLLVTATVAAWRPAVRASRVDPVTALKAQ